MLCELIYSKKPWPLGYFSYFSMNKIYVVDALTLEAPH